MTEPDVSPDFREQAEQIMREKFAPWVLQLQLAVESTRPVVLRLGTRPELCRVGNILCGQAIMAAADTAMVLVVSEALGGFADMATVNMNTSFLSAVIDEDALVSVELTKLGRNMAFGDARLHGARTGRLCAQASLVYALQRR
jgi:acyl-coenzyme A thioesterase PaaI-like protein